jgi:antitoxin (DNA-binding transcriptional repressor) of toxin-antitoxin stability system
MRIVTSRDLKNNPAILASEGITVVTSKGKPIALCIPLLEGDDVASLSREVLRLRAKKALDRIRAKAEELGPGAADPAGNEILGEISATRVARKKPNGQP